MKKKKKKRNRMSRTFVKQWDDMAETEKLGALVMGQADVQISPIYTRDGKHIESISLDIPANIDRRALRVILSAAKEAIGSIRAGGEQMD